jgi:CHAD domain-containing protein/HD superfamily phosphodiesterase
MGSAARDRESGFTPRHPRCSMLAPLPAQVTPGFSMASAAQAPQTRKQKQAGLAHWMARVLKECHRVAQDFDADTVHDLRVALRRCRTISDEFQNLDPDPAWRKLKKASKKLFRTLGALRDNQVMQEWVEKLGGEDDALRQKLLDSLTAEEQRARSDVARALDHFDQKAWRKWSRTLPEHTRKVPREGLAFQHLALERWNDAHELHRRALRARSGVAWHRLRIGLKKFRYTVENFLPKRYDQWGEGLKRFQDLLGEVHDLDVLWAAVRKASAGGDASFRVRWKEAIENERRTRLAEYTSRTRGPDSLWLVWRGGLPEGKRVEAAAIAKLAAFASFRDPDVAHSQRVRGLALELFSGFQKAGLNSLFREARERRILDCAALLHDVGRSEKSSGHHKLSYRIIRDLPAPLGWTSEDMLWTALAARYHRGAEPRGTHQGFGALSPAEQQRIAWLAAVLRLADSLDGEHNGRVLHVKVETTREALLIRAQGYNEEMALTAEVAEKKHLLETLCGKPVILRPDEIQPEAASASLAS